MAFENPALSGIVRSCRRFNKIVSQWSARVIAPAVLTIAAVSKAIYPAGTAVLTTAYGIPPLLLLMMIPIELLLATVLLFGIRLRASLIVTAALFSLFATFSLYRALKGFESCGCFGSVKVNPWFTFGLDVVIVFTILHTIRNFPALDSEREPINPRRFALAACFFAASATPFTTYAVLHQPLSLVGSKQQLPQSGLVILEPELWIGSTMPLSNALKPAIDMSTGHWKIVLYHHNCPKCQKALPRYVELAQKQQANLNKPDGNESGVVLVEVPPCGSRIPVSPAIYVTLPTDREWFVQAPVEIGLKDGIVQYASRELPSIDVDWKDAR